MGVKTSSGEVLSWTGSRRGEAKSKSTIRPGSTSDCTSVSCDSPGSKHSASLHRPTHVKIYYSSIPASEEQLNIKRVNKQHNLIMQKANIKQIFDNWG
nr:unnamed protein product [Callosobruchus analis]